MIIGSRKRTCSRGHFSVCCFVAVLVLGLAAGGFCTEIPTVEKLTGGKVRVGEFITRKNVDTVKEWLTPGTYEQVKRGMVLFLVPTTPMEATLPAYFLEATKRNTGKAVIGKNGVTYTREGKKWPGGFPFPDPKTGDEAMANQKVGLLYGADDFSYHVKLDLVDKTGKSYNYSLIWYRKIASNARMKVPPVPAFPGHEEEAFRSSILFTEPDYIRGIRQVFIRHYDETARPDEGYLYLPALKRSRVVSAINFQDSMGGSDLTWGDTEGFLEPFSLWTFKLLGKANMIMPGKDNPSPKRQPDGSIIPTVPLDAVAKFPRMQWEVRPVVIVEARPKGTHIYGKQVFYLDGLDWRNAIAEKYDKQGRLWKAWTAGGGLFRGKDCNNYGVTYYPQQYDLQTDHMTRFTAVMGEMNGGQDINGYSMRQITEIEY